LSSQRQAGDEPGGCQAESADSPMRSPVRCVTYYSARRFR
jgi:hypothetical protein